MNRKDLITPTIALIEVSLVRVHPVCPLCAEVLLSIQRQEGNPHPFTPVGDVADVCEEKTGCGRGIVINAALYGCSY